MARNFSHLTILRNNIVRMFTGTTKRYGLAQFQPGVSGGCYPVLAEDGRFICLLFTILYG